MSRNFTADQAAPGRSWVAVTKSDTVNLAPGCRFLYVGGTGDVALVGDDDVVCTFSAVPVGVTLNVGPKRVNSTNTTATLLIAIY